MIRVNKRDLEYLASLDPPVELRRMVDAAQLRGGEISDDDADDLREFCGDKLCLIGFYADYEPNADGLRLEGIIDRLFTG